MMIFVGISVLVILFSIHPPKNARSSHFQPIHNILFIPLQTNLSEDVYFFQTSKSNKSKPPNHNHPIHSPYRLRGGWPFYPLKCSSIWRDSLEDDATKWGPKNTWKHHEPLLEVALLYFWFFFCCPASFLPCAKIGPRCENPNEIQTIVKQIFVAQITSQSNISCDLWYLYSFAAIKSSTLSQMTS